LVLGRKVVNGVIPPTLFIPNDVYDFPYHNKCPASVWIVWASQINNKLANVGLGLEERDARGFDWGRREQHTIDDIPGARSGLGIGSRGSLLPDICRKSIGHRGGSCVADR